MIKKDASSTSMYTPLNKLKVKASAPFIAHQHQVNISSFTA